MTFGSKWLSNISPDDIMEEIDEEKIAITVLNSDAYRLSKKYAKIKKSLFFISPVKNTLSGLIQ